MSLVDYIIFMICMGWISSVLVGVLLVPAGGWAKNADRD